MVSLLQQQAVNLQNESADNYLSSVSNESLEVLEHFGAESPKLLNDYSCALEDALIEQVRRGQAQHLVIKAAGEEHRAMNTLLTNPDELANYVNGFFGPRGPYPTMTDSEKQQFAVHQERAALEQYEQSSRSGVPPTFQRPQMEMPSPSKSSSAANTFWNNFSGIMDSNPEDAWKYLSQAPGQAFQSKMLVQDL